MIRTAELRGACCAVLAILAFATSPLVTAHDDSAKWINKEFTVRNDLPTPVPHLVQGAKFKLTKKGASLTLNYVDPDNWKGWKKLEFSCSWTGVNFDETLSQPPPPDISLYNHCVSLDTVDLHGPKAHLVYLIFLAKPYQNKKATILIGLPHDDEVVQLIVRGGRFDFTHAGGVAHGDN